MKYIAKNNKEVQFRSIDVNDIDLLSEYLTLLSDETRSRFGPHGFDLHSLIAFFKIPAHLGYVAIDDKTGEIVAYSVVKLGYLEHDSSRLSGYGVKPDHRIDSTFAPSVADAWQGFGVGNKLFQFVLEDLRSRGLKRIILWGGVQKSNEKAVNFYLRNQFRILGEFEYNGWNYDMMYLIV